MDPDQRPSGPVPLLLLLALGALAIGCERPEPSTSLAPSFGRFVAADEVYVLPGREWSWEGDRWRFHRRGTLHVYLPEAAGRALEIEVPLDELTRQYTVRASWDGEALASDPGPATETGVWRIEIPAEGLDAGLHDLFLERDYQTDGGRVRGARPETDVREVRLSFGRRSWTLDPAKKEWQSHLATFLNQQITGLGPERMGGVLFHGPGRSDQDLSLPAGARLEATVENRSETPARFRVEWSGDLLAEVNVPPGERRFLGAEAAAGRGRFRVEVDGEDDGLFLFGAPFLAIPDAAERPDLVVVTLDTTRLDAVAPYAPEAPTPNLAAFAETSTVFTRAYATSPWTLPSHASIFTGLWPGEHRAALEEPHLPFGYRTLPERLRADGYFTAGLAGGYLCHHRFGLGQGMHIYRDPEAFETPGDRLTDAALALLEERRGRPLFLFVNYFDPHALYRAPDPFAREAGVEEAAEPLRDHPIWGPVTRGETSALADAIRGKGGFDDAVRAYLAAAYRSEIAFMDHQLGRLFDGLKEAGTWDRSMVVVVSDHGELLGEEGLYTHGHRLDPELTAIPLMIKWPGQTEGRRIDSLVSQVDLFPTLLREARSTVPDGQHGLLLHREEAGRALERRQRVFMEEHNSGPHPLFAEMKVADHLYGVQEPGRREIVWEGERRCFHRVDGEPDETPAWEQEPCPDEPVLSLAQLEAILGHDEAQGAETQAMGPEDEKALRALGYL